MRIVHFWRLVLQKLFQKESPYLNEVLPTLFLSFAGCVNDGNGYRPCG